ncbi:unnamed protein product (macronuclear) [Paramecium tetraurelia]|uniref:Transmembrane protein n=1 Tax=Paramecium tetraurelia TaxID=5888 RepID=A0D3S6_PARTE|nr:uncharacterized protein GSPATT00013158001 [Paramecium tetraurelia]CAK77693.1 unnamed protein product [Paramecium tetraurelia]|eukprot:XP_001445090.1 hypothetical protein (macronuclear) [Paramecium tetraurelia strain d4-2]
MGQSVKCCNKQEDSLSEIYSQQIQAEYFGPEYAHQYQIQTKFITHFQAYDNEEKQLRKETQTLSTRNHVDSELAQSPFQKNDKYLINTDQILDSFFNLDSNNSNSSYENSICANNSILKKTNQQTPKHTKCVKFKDICSKISFSISQKKELGQSLKIQHKQFHLFFEKYYYFIFNLFFIIDEFLLIKQKFKSPILQISHYFFNKQETLQPYQDESKFIIINAIQFNQQHFCYETYLNKFVK